MRLGKKCFDFLMVGSAKFLPRKTFSSVLPAILIMTDPLGLVLNAFPTQLYVLEHSLNLNSALLTGLKFSDLRYYKTLFKWNAYYRDYMTKFSAQGWNFNPVFTYPCKLKWNDYIATPGIILTQGWNFFHVITHSI